MDDLTGERLREDMEQILGKDKGSGKRFLRMLRKAKLPYVWILGYIIISFALSHVGINVTEYTAEMFAGNVGFTTVIVPFLFYTVLSLIVASVSGVLSNLCVSRIDRNFRRMVWGKVVKLPLRFYDRNNSKELISRITTDVNTISLLIMQVFVPIITTAYALFITLRKIGTYDRELMFALIMVLPLNILIAFIMGKLQFGVRDVVNKKNAELTGMVSERLNSFLLVKSLGNEEKELQNGQKKMREVYKSNILNTWMGVSGPMYAIAGMMQFIIIVMVGRQFYANGTLTLTSWIAYFGFASIIVNNLTAYCGYWTSIKASQGATNRVAKIMEEIEEDVEIGETAEHLCGDIRLEHVSFSYGTTKVFQDLNLIIPEGKVTAIIGPSGSGKTTLLNILEGLYGIEEGKIFFGKDDRERFSLKSFRERIAYVTQETTMFNGSIQDNLLFGVKKKVTPEELEEICKMTGVADFADEMEQGLLSNVGENGDRLSGGQKQRIAIARAILKDGDYLFLDEATAAMDIRSKDYVWEGIRNKYRGKTIFMVAHDRQTVLKADCIVVMAGGKIVATGEKEEVARNNEYFRNFVGEEV